MGPTSRSAAGRPGRCAEPAPPRHKCSPLQPAGSPWAPAACGGRTRRRRLAQLAPRAAVAEQHDAARPGAAAVVRPGKSNVSDANFPVDGEGRTYHLGTRRGEVANRILSVGSEKRALMLAECLEPAAPGRSLFMLESSRGFLTVTGRYRGVPVSIVVTHMGMANADFVMRENRAVVEGEMAVLRLGTCGALQPPARLGSFVVADPGAVLVRRNPDAFGPEGEAAGLAPYTFSRPIPADPRLSAALAAEAAAALGHDGVCAGLNATADSFYSSQGRRTGLFDDRNESLLSDLLRRHPGVVTLEMETATLLDLARCSRGSIRAAAGVIVLADRASNAFLGAERIEQLERAAGRACLAALAGTELDDAWAPRNGCGPPVWEA